MIDTAELEKLKYRRQYLITPKPVKCPFLHKQYRLNSNHQLYAHVDLLVTEHMKGELKIVLLGDMFDYEAPRKGNRDILRDLQHYDFETFLKATSKYTGRYVLIYIRQNYIFLVSDASTSRKVFFSEFEENLWFASQPSLLASLLGFEKTKDPSKLSYYGSKVFTRLNNSNIGDITIYDEIRQLTSNRYFDVFKSEVHRFWPDKEVKYRPVQDVAEQCAIIIKGIMESIVHRYDVMLPVTAGKDSRLLLAGARDVKDNIFYYLNLNEKLNDKHPDIRITKTLFKKLDLDFNLLSIEKEVDEDFMRIYFQNNELATRKYLPQIYNYYCLHQNKVNLPANFVHAYWGNNILHENNVTPETITRLYGVDQFDFAVTYYREWLASCHKLCRDLNIRIVTLFYWEERVGNGVPQIQLDKDIAQEEFNPLNSRLLNELFFSVKLEYNNVPDFIIFKKITKILWPDLMTFPVNPSFRRSTQMILKKIGLLNLTFKILYKTARG